MENMEEPKIEFVPGIANAQRGLTPAPTPNPIPDPFVATASAAATAVGEETPTEEALKAL